MAPDAASSVPPPMMWAEDPQRLFLTVVVECTGTDYKFTKDSFSFKGTGVADNKLYEVKLDFLHEINPEDVTSKNNARCVEYTIGKAEKGTFWKNLTKDKKKPHFLKIDFNKWHDEDSDEREDEDMFDQGLLDKFCNMSGNAGGGGGGEEKASFNDYASDDSDDDYPDLVEHN